MNSTSNSGELEVDAASADAAGIHPANIVDLTGKKSRMIGWKTMVNSPDVCLSVLNIVREKNAHTVRNPKKEYDECIDIVFEGQKNSDGTRDGIALFGAYVKWSGNYANRKMKELVDGIIDWGADDNNFDDEEYCAMVGVDQYRSLALIMKEERDSAAKRHRDEVERKNMAKQAIRESNESRERDLGFRPEAVGVGYSGLENILGVTGGNDDDFDSYLDGISFLGQAPASRPANSGEFTLSTCVKKCYLIIQYASLFG